MEFWMILLGVVCLLALILWLQVEMRMKEEKEKKRLTGLPIDKLESNTVYHRCIQPEGLVFLFKGNEEINPRTYILEGVDIEKLPNSFMFLDGEKIVVWDPISLYAEDVPSNSLPSDEIIELEDLAGKQPA